MGVSAHHPWTGLMMKILRNYSGEKLPWRIKGGKWDTNDQPSTRVGVHGGLLVKIIKSLNNEANNM